MGNMCSGSRVSELEKVVEEQTAQLETREEELAGLRRSSTLKSEELERVRAAMQAELEAKEEAKAQEIRERDEHIAELTTRASGLEEAIGSLRAETEEAGSDRARRVAELEAQLAGTVGEVEDLKAQQREAERLRQEFDEQKRRVEELEPKVEELTQQLSERERELEQTRQDRQERMDEIRSLSERITQLQNKAQHAETAQKQLTLTRSQIDDLQIELAAKRRIEEETERLRSEVAEKERMLKQERRRSVQLEQAVAANMLQIHKCFGLPLAQTPSEAVDGYASPVPTVLVRLFDALKAQGGVDKAGIFRLASGQSSIAEAKAALNSGSFESVEDPSTAANLIGVWFRELPAPILEPLDLGKVVKLKKPKAAWKLVTSGIAEPELSVFSWLMDVGVQVSARADQNRMTAKNLAIVFAPNLFRMPEVSLDLDRNAADKMMDRIKGCAVFIELCIQHRAEQQQQNA